MEWLETILKFDKLIAAIVAPLIGLFVYFRRKEYEIVRRRYLEDGIDEVLKYLEYIDSIFRHNWARSLTCLKQFRDSGSDMSKDLYTEGYINLEPPTFQMSRNYIIWELTKDDVFFNVLQLFLAFVGNANAFIMYDLCFAVRISIEGGKELKGQVPKNQLVDDYFEEIRKLDKKSHKFAILHSELHRISSILAKERLTFKSVEDFRSKAIVQNSILSLKKAFENELSPYQK